MTEFDKAVNEFHRQHPQCQRINYDVFVWFPEVRTVFVKDGCTRKTILPKAARKVYGVRPDGTTYLHRLFNKVW